jgi:hypothetical protein
MQNRQHDTKDEFNTAKFRQTQGDSGLKLLGGVQSDQQVSITTPDGMLPLPKRMTEQIRKESDEIGASDSYKNILDS